MGRNPWGALAILAAVTYGWLRLTSAVFYWPLGVSPEQVGASYPAILAQSVVGLFVLFAFAALFGAILFATLWALSRPFPANGGPLARWNPRSPARLWPILGLVGWVVAEGVLAVLVGPRTWLTVTAVPALAALALCLCAARPWLRETGFGGVVKGVATASCVLAVVGLLFTAFVWGRLAWSQGAAPPGLFEVLFPWTDRTAQVVWNGSPPQGLDGGCVIYLGDTDNGPFVLATDAKGHRRALSVTPDRGQVTIVPDAYGCSRWPKARKG